MHISNTCAAFCSVSFAELEKNLFFLSTDAANKLAVSLILCRLDFFNSLLAGVPDKNWIDFSAYRIMQPNLSSIGPGMQEQQHCLEHSTGFQWRLGFSTNYLSLFSVDLLE